MCENRWGYFRNFILIDKALFHLLVGKVTEYEVISQRDEPASYPGPLTCYTPNFSLFVLMFHQVLLEKASAEQAKSIETAYRMLTDDSEMGNCFKFFAASGGSEKPPGF